MRSADAVRKRIVRHMGIALDADEKAKLRVMAPNQGARKGFRSSAVSLLATAYCGGDARWVSRPIDPSRETIATLSTIFTYGQSEARS